MAVRILPMGEEHIPLCEALISVSFSSEAWSAQGLREGLHVPYDISLVALEDGASDAPFGAPAGDPLVGFLCARLVCGEGTLNLIAVNPARRGRGIATRLLGELLARPGAERYSLEVRESNRAAIALYRKFGFAAAGRRRGFYHLPDEDALVMTWKPSEKNKSVSDASMTWSIMD